MSGIVGAWGRTIWGIADECSPSTVGHLDEAHLDLDLADGVIALRGVYLTFERLEDESLVAVRVGKLSRHSCQWRLLGEVECI